MVGTLIKTQTHNGFFIGIIKDHFYEAGTISVGVTWNDNDETTETFNEYTDYSTFVYHFYYIMFQANYLFDLFCTILYHHHLNL